ncbi:hypothetical protein CONPUDRAFT_140867 [Coniophora puteana RWD-64-598 SS2]|uniref:DUF6533 domain-containing protein n=1 Tax=Coniophora puteana (strain RWD-64-598) TaxID=741705 RepID=A0A5M3N4G4_CONPW|nr:uncharacterized protein CONPUDRAFT_140867 [Coniophora puteana RWD-64-598 SS2]EIW86198.1 hypothetical protein CONPUDRAFT_140867 [Coniophora puteana RWD-64-598 SS2]
MSADFLRCDGSTPSIYSSLVIQEPSLGLPSPLGKIASILTTSEFLHETCRKPGEKNLNEVDELFKLDSPYWRIHISRGLLRASKRSLVSRIMTTLDGTALVDAATSYQTFNYVYVSVAALWVYDYVVTLDVEISFLRYSYVRRIKALYLATRFLPFAMLGIHLFRVLPVCSAAHRLFTARTVNLDPGESEAMCNLYDDVSSGLSLLIVLCSESLFILRTYAVWKCDKRILALILASFIIAIVLTVVVSFLPSVPGSSYIILPGAQVTGCFLLYPAVFTSIPYILLIAFEIELIILNIVQGYRVRRETKGRLFGILLQHNLFYFTCGLLFSILNVAIALTTQYGYSTMFENLQVIIHAILATRMHRMLWIRNENRSSHSRWQDSTTVVNIEMLPMTSA